MKHLLYLLIFIVVFSSCKEEKQLTVQQIVDEAIDVSGGEKLENTTISFKFRNKQYKATRDSNGEFRLEREFKDSISHYRDVIDNDGFVRFINDVQMTVPDTMAIKYAASVNSVHYFVQLPYGLNVPAVNKSLLGDEIINERNYHKVKVTFNKEGGGEDFEDEFIYWIHTETYKVDYLAYSYNEDDGMGLRFREAYNERYINGIRFVDYNNYKPNSNDVLLEKLGSLFEKSALKLLSKIEIENVMVN